MEHQKRPLRSSDEDDVRTVISDYVNDVDPLSTGSFMEVWRRYCPYAE